MIVKALGKIEAVAFDIDGTLYPQWKIHFNAFPKYIRHSLFFLYYGLVRNDMHKLDRIVNFREIQAAKMAEKMRCTPFEAEEKLESIIYYGLKKYFKRINPYPHIEETFAKFKKAGLKIALLSDFPPEQKGDIWGVKKYCDVILGSEALGALKPSAYPFIEMAKVLKIEPSKILYVGNSIKYDVHGARNAGMKSAYIMPFWRKMLNKPFKEADICFSNYRQLQNIVLK